MDGFMEVLLASKWCVIRIWCMTLFDDKNQVVVLECLCPFIAALSTNEFGKNVELFARVRGYGVCGGTH
jgi:hypothetical protein